MPAISFSPYAGTSRKLVVAVDVGTTFSGVSYAILDPGEAPKIQSVNRFPGQAAGDYKIPSVLWYTRDGNVHSAGAEAANTCAMSAADKEKLVFVEWFKLHLRPQSMASQEDVDFTIKALPKDKTFIEQNQASGESLWDSVKGDFDMVLSHPNGWEGLEQAKMREAAVHAGLFLDVSSERLHFVTEGEASVNFCVYHELAKNEMKDNTSILIVDAGGGTIDLSAYRVATVSPISLEELVPAMCLLQGSIMINMRFEKALRKRLANSKYNKDSDISKMLQLFDTLVKPTFTENKAKYYIHFGSSKDEDGAVGIKNGQLEVLAATISKSFEPTSSSVVDAIKALNEASSQKISLAFLVGGFAASTWLFERLKERLRTSGLDIFRPNSHMNKAVSEGAIVHYLSHRVVARVARLTIGTVCGVDFDEANTEHVKRRDKCKYRPCGILTVPGKFVPLVLKGTSIGEDSVAFRSMCREHKAPKPEGEAAANILVYRGTMELPEWVDEDPDQFGTLCTISADTSTIESTPRSGADGGYFAQLFDVVLQCGMTEWNVYLRWKHEGVEKRGTAKIAYREDIRATVTEATVLHQDGS